MNLSAVLSKSLKNFAVILMGIVFDLLIAFPKKYGRSCFTELCVLKDLKNRPITNSMYSVTNFSSQHM